MNEFIGSDAEQTARSRLRPPVAATAFLSLLAFGFLLPQPAIVRGSEPPKVPKESVEVWVRGQLQFKSRKVAFEGTVVGKEFDKRKYIAGDPDSPQRGIWNFDAIPRGLMSISGDVVPAKFTCSTFQLTKAAGAGGARVVIRVVSHTCPQVPPDLQQRGEWQWVNNKVDAQGKTPKDRYQVDVAAYRVKKIDPETAKPDTEGWKTANELAEKYGYYEFRLPKVLDGVETSIDLPAGLVRNAMKNDPETDANGKPKRPLVSIYVKCETAGLLIGMAEPDLYLVERTPAKR